MSENLLIIESPNKIETLGGFLPKSFVVIATIGHIRDLSKRNGYDEKTLEPHWTISNKLKKNAGPMSKTQQQIVDQITIAAHKAKHIWLAADPDREGEAIAWHVYEVLNAEDKKKCKRITFNEITDEAVNEALQHPRKINIEWVHSQFARRILDRMIGFGLSDIVRKKLHAQSAGRVQTVALKFIYDREKEILAFKTDKWFVVKPMLENMTLPIVLRELSPKLKGLHTYFVDEEKNEVKTFDKEKVYEVCFKDEESAKKLKDNLDKKCEIYKIDEPKLKMRNPNVPFKTSTMQQEAIYKLGMNIGKVTSTAQKLYEGIKLNGKHTALISYPRTDSIRLADSFVNKTKSYITKELGEKEFFYRTFESKASAGKNVQDAHEGIRVIDPFLTPDSLKNKISHDEYSLYKLIWKRSVAAYMNPSKIESTAVRLINNENKFFTRSSKVIYPGYRKVWEFDDSVGNEKIDFTKYKVGDKLEIKQILIQDGKKASPPRYNQASLVKELDEQGVGRPSTYRSMAQIALDRGYAYLDNKAYVMNPLGNEVIEGLEKFFPEIVDAKFTRDMEGRLDEIARNDENWKEWVLSFQPKFKKEIKIAEEKLKRAEPEQVLDEHGKLRLCPKCKSPLVKRFSRVAHIYFVGCSAYPACNYAEFPEQKNHHPQKILDEKCPLCGANLAERTNKRGQKFIGCTGYPKCRYARPINVTAEEYEKIKLEKQKEDKNNKGKTSTKGKEKILAIKKKK